MGKGGRNKGKGAVGGDGFTQAGGRNGGGAATNYDDNVPDDEVLRTLQACYVELGDDRKTDTLQPHEVLLLASKVCFFDVAHQIASEISELDGHAAPTFGEAGLLEFIQARGLVWPREFTLSEFSSGSNRVRILYSLLLELLTSRLLTNKVLRRVLDANTAVEVQNEATAALMDAANSCGVKADANVAHSVILQSIATAKPRKSAPHLLVPDWKTLEPHADTLNDIIAVLNGEYTERRKVMCRRLDVTIQAFQKSEKAPQFAVELSKVIGGVMNWRDKAIESDVTVHDLLAADTSILTTDRISSKYALKSAVKTIVIGAVPDRGGVPEGYTIDALAKDIVKANLALQVKDAGGKGKGGKVSYAQEAALVSRVRDREEKKWLGAEDMDLAASDRKGGKGKGKGKGKGGGKDKGGKTGGGSGYYASMAQTKTTEATGGGGGGGGFYASKGGGATGGGGGGGGGFYANKGGGGGNTAGGGGFYAQKENSGGGGGGGGGGFSASQGKGGGGGKSRGGGFGGRAQDSASSNSWMRR